MNTIALMGLGKMGSALAAGMRRALPSLSLHGYDLLSEARLRFSQETGSPIFTSPADAVEAADTVILAVKPQNFPELAHTLAGKLAGKTVFSILAGIPLETLSRSLQTQRIIRVMPNLPVTVGRGVCCYATLTDVTEEDVATAEEILSASGVCFRVDESQLDAVTGLSGSGPAFVFEFMIGLVQGATSSGLSAELARKLAAETLIGSALMALQSPLALETLRDNVISPNGTTAAGMEALVSHEFAVSASEAVVSATLRSIELGRKN